jgi:glycosyltransferase involved in cell wall biosynthesis
LRLDSVYVAYWSLRDPLCQSQSLPVLRALARRGWRVGLLTFEQEQWALAPPEREAEAAALRAEGIEWRPLTYHKEPAVLSSLYDIVHGTWTCARLARSGRARLVHGRGTVANAVAWGASVLARTKFFDDADGPLSDEYVDAGIWAAGSVPHRATRWAESRFFAKADAAAVLSEGRRAEVAALAHVPVEVLPCAVDMAQFVPDAAAGAARRRELGLAGTVLVYSGKFGGWYRGDAVVDFAAAARPVLGDVSLLVLTPEDPRPFIERAQSHGLRCLTRRARREEMPAYLSAADAGLSLRVATPSQRACSPIKNGEYLSCGLPVVTTPGAGDYSELVVRERVGVVLQGMDTGACAAAAAALAALLAEPGVRERCRAVARRHVGLDEVVVPRYVAIYEALLAGAPRP